MSTEQQQRDIYQNKAMSIMWKSLFVIGGPAFTLLIVGQALDKHFASGMKITIALLFLAIFLSWTIIWRQYKKYNLLVEEIETKIKKDKQAKQVK